jgi:hypothetical protein
LASSLFVGVGDPSHGDDGSALLRFFSRRIFLVLLIFSARYKTTTRGGMLFVFRFEDGT